MNMERRQVLDMLAEGKINAEEAERLLERLAQAGGGETSEAEGLGVAAGGSGGLGSGAPEAGSGTERPAPGGLPATTGKGAGGKTPKFLRVVVHSNDGDQVNVRVPIALVRTGLKLSAMLPSDAQEKLRDKGIDFSNLSGLDSEEMIEALRELTVDVDSADGDVVRVFCE